MRLLQCMRDVRIVYASASEGSGMIRLSATATDATGAALTYLCNNCEMVHCLRMDMSNNGTAERRNGALARVFAANRVVAFTAVSIDAVLDVLPLSIDPSTPLGTDSTTNTIHATIAIATEWKTARSYMKGI